MWSVRCRNSKCRHRRRTRKHPDEHLRVHRCPVCGERKGWRVEKRQYARRDRCTCSGYHYPHQRRTSPCCDHHPQGWENQAARAGYDVTDSSQYL